MRTRFAFLLSSMVALFVGLIPAASPSYGFQIIVHPAPSGDSTAAGNVPVARGEGRHVAEAIAEELTKRFVFPKVAEQYSAMLRFNSVAGRYDVGTRTQLANKLTQDLLAVHNDGHLHVLVAAERSGRMLMRMGSANGTNPIQTAKWISPGVAYIRPTAFLGTPTEIAEITQFMRDHRGAKAIIFDLRNHHGGGLEEMNVIFSYLYRIKTPLVGMEMRRSTFEEGGAPFQASPELQRADSDGNVRFIHYAVPGSDTPLTHAAVYLLTSNRTASAAEHFALAIKATHRGTLIGEATAGANHFGGPVPVGANFAVWMPVGRTFNLRTGEDWEGSGVKPDIAVDPKFALVTALEKAGLSRAQASKLDAQEVPAEPIHKDIVAVNWDGASR